MSITCHGLIATDTSAPDSDQGFADAAPWTSQLPQTKGVVTLGADGQREGCTSLGEEGECLTIVAFTRELLDALRLQELIGEAKLLEGAMKHARSRYDSEVQLDDSSTWSDVAFARWLIEFAPNGIKSREELSAAVEEQDGTLKDCLEEGNPSERIPALNTFRFVEKIRERLLALFKDLTQDEIDDPIRNIVYAEDREEMGKATNQLLEVVRAKLTTKCRWAEQFTG